MSPRSVLAIALLLAASTSRTSGDERPAVLRDRTPWTTSRFRGTPEPPRPYRAERIFEKLRFDKPVVVTSEPSIDRLFVAEQGGRVVSFPTSAVDVEEPDLVGDLRQAVEGLDHVYGFAFHPDFERNRLIYVCTVVGSDKPDGSVVSSFRLDRVDPPSIDPSSRSPIISWLSGGHNGGCLKFGQDGYLYISTGDGVGPFPPDKLMTGQDNSDLLSAILRIDVDRSEEGRAYAVPPDNPFVDLEGVRPETWAYGFRNPWKMSVDPRTGKLWVGDVGWELWEMVYLVERGGNYGWSVTEGRQPVHPDAPRGPTPILPPVVDHPHSEARSITGGHVYRGKRLGDLVGAYVYADYETGKVWALWHDGERVTRHLEVADTQHRIAAFGLDGAGELYFADYTDGHLYRLSPNESTGDHLEFPRRLSETGLFESVVDLEPAPGVREYNINAEPWIDGATAQRHLATPGTGRVQTGRDRWRFPEGTVLAKTMSIELEPGRPASAHRIETQVLHHAEKIWHAYTYAWNDEQTDAKLVGAAGRDRVLTIRDPSAPGGTRLQTWRHASRAECLICHNFFANTVLGLSNAQLDREGDGRLVDPRDATATLDERARSYLHVNCSHCHRRHSGGTSAIELLHGLELSRTNTLDVRPVLGSFGIPDARIIAPGDPYRSVLYYRMATLGAARMPHLGSRVMDREGVELIHDWIAGLGENDGRPAIDGAGREALAVASNGAGDPRCRPALDRLLASTSGALFLKRALDRDETPDDVALLAIERAVASTDPSVRDLFREFVPEEDRRKTLGTAIDAAEILAMRGDGKRGREIFLADGAAQCTRCHSLDGTGTPIGPDLRGVGSRLDRERLLASLIEPSREIDPAYALHLLVTRDGRALTGLLVQRNDSETVLRDARGELVTVPSAEVNLLAPQRNSLMPDFLLRDMTAQDAADLLAFLASLRDGE